LPKIINHFQVLHFFKKDVTCAAFLNQNQSQINLKNMKDKKLLISFLTLVFGCALFLNAVAMVLPQNSLQQVTNPNDIIQMAGNHFSLIKNNQVTGNVDSRDILEGEKAIKKLKSERALGLNWTSRGPDNVAGRTKSIIIDNRDATGKTLFAGSVSGGVWKSVTEGLTWTQVDGSGINLNVSCMAQAANGDIYAGTGEDFINGWGVPALLGRGIFKSTDGNSFSLLAATSPSGNEWNFINELAINMASSRVYAATNTGLKYSDDGGVSWNLANSSTGEDLTGNASDVKVSSAGSVVASVNNQCWISENGDANSFRSVSNDTVDGLLPSTGVGRFEFAFAPSDPNVLYAIAAFDGTRIGSTKGALENIYKSTDKGSSWTVIGPGGSDNFDPFGTLNHGLYGNTIAVFPDDPNRILAGGLNIWEGKKVLETGYYQWELRFPSREDIHSITFAPNAADAIYMTADFGLFVISYDFQVGKSLNKTYNTSQFYSVAFSNNNEEIMGGTQGVGPIYINGNGNSPEAATAFLPAVVGGYTEISQIDPKVFIYSGKGADLYRSNDKGATTSATFLLDAGMVNDSSLITPFVLWESFDNVYSRDSITYYAKKDSPADTTVVMLSDNGKFPFNFTIHEALTVGDSVRVQDIVSSKFFVAFPQGANSAPGSVYMTKHVHDFTKIPDWDKIAVINGTPMSLAYSKDANYLFVGTTLGKLYRISNIALAYDSLRADVASTSCIISTSLINTFNGRAITSISVDPKNSAHIIVTLGNYGNTDYIFECSNALNEFPTFNSAQGNLPKVPVYTSLIEMNSSSRIMIGTDYGVFTTENLGSSSNWTQENSGMGEVPVMMLRQQTLDRVWSPGVEITKNLGAIFIATNGRGLFENRSFVGISEYPQIVTNNTIRIFPNPANEKVTISFMISTFSGVTLNIFDLSGHLVKSENLGMLKSGNAEYTLSTRQMDAGSYVLQIVTGNSCRSTKLVVVH
jgi:hypothetical protein